MTNYSLAAVAYVFFLIFLGYFLLLTLFYFFLTIVGFIEGRLRQSQGESEDYPLLYFSAITPSVSIVIPARNEEEWIRDSLLSILKLNYPDFELIVVDDGSTDRTPEILREVLELKGVDMPYIKHYQDGSIKKLLRSSKYPNVTVIEKPAGAKKAGALNAGMNLAKNEYVCAMDADTILEPDALLKVMAHIAKDPQRIIGIGSYFGLVNGLGIKDGSIMDNKFSWNPILAYQNLEYIRSFIGLRIAWSRFNAMPTVAGGFSLWRRDVLYALGGYSLDFTCEDIELTFRGHKYIADNKEKKYKIMMLPYSVGWTEGPSNIASLIKQRERWQRVTNETVAKYAYMLFNPAYGAFGFLTLPYHLFYEVLGVFVEFFSIALVAAGWMAKLIDAKVFFAYLFLMITTQTFISLLAVLSFAGAKKRFSPGYVIYMMCLSFFEFFIYRWMIAASKLAGTLNYARKIKSFDQYTRAKRFR